MPRIHIGVLIYGCADTSVRCVRSLITSRFTEPVVFHLLDNGSPEPDATAIRLALTGLHIGAGNCQAIFSTSNLGCAAGWNTLIRVAQQDPEFEYIVLVGHDVFPHPDALQNLVVRYERGDVDMVTGVPYEVDVELTPHDDEAPGPDFSMILIPKRVINAVGLFDEAFWPAYFEDNDYHHRTKLHGCGLGIRTNLAPFRHFRSTTIKRYGELNQYFAKNQAYFVQKWGGPPGEVGASLPWRGVGAVEE